MKVVLLFSGGVDSTVALYDHVRRGEEVVPLFFDYGQPHLDREGLAVERIASKLGIRYVLRRLPGMPMDGRQGADSIVPGRNLVMVSAAASYALQVGASGVASAVSKSDHEVYPDCRPPFNRALDALIFRTYGVSYLTRFECMDKKQIVLLGESLGAPLSDTWSCYEGGSAPCGACGACAVRAEAFR